jgi:CBS domain-containing protein
MSPNQLSGPLVQEVPVLREDATVEEAVRTILESGMPALPVVDGAGGLTGIFGEREFMAALFPGYVRELRFAGFVPKRLDDALEKRAACRAEPVKEHMNTEHVDVHTDASDVQVAETFLHHRVLIIPVTDGGQVKGVITRSDFFSKLAKRFLEPRAGETPES